ncbi:MAG TPA: GtrA family protein [Methylomirabilota bacterium]|nr:GtrA family protein [Methylomirabilota bacterium]
MMRAPFRFCAVGTLVFGVDYAGLWLFHHFLPRLVAVSLAYFLAVSVHFCLNKWWVFRSKAPLEAVEAAKYVLTVLTCWLCTITVVWLALRFLTPNVFVAKTLAIPPATLLSFLLMRGFVFR